ncbi:hypothetical protein HYV98_00665 [Candidatus Azambacteria bacterium]|nr:hypothetical protein [Candidatus Azambacteria bacterium]
MKSLVRFLLKILRGIGRVLAVFQRIILFTLLYLVAGLIARIARMRRKTSPNPASYWLRREDRRDFLHQY